MSKSKVDLSFPTAPHDPEIAEGGREKENPAISDPVAEALASYQKARSEFDALELTIQSMKNRISDTADQIAKTESAIESAKNDKQAALSEFAKSGSDANLLKAENGLQKLEGHLLSLRARIPAIQAAIAAKHPELIALESSVNRAREGYWKQIEHSMQSALKDSVQAIVDCFLTFLASGGKYHSFGDYCERLCKEFGIIPGKLDSAALVPVHPVRAKITEGERSKAKYPPQSKIESRNFEGSRLIEKDGMQVFSQSIVPKTDDSLEPKGES